MTIVGYARTSTRHQSTDGQLDALTSAGCERIYAEQSSGAAALPELARMLAEVDCGDVVVVTRLDRLGRSLPAVLHTVQELDQRGIELRSLREALDSTTPAGRLLRGMLLCIAEYERELMLERQADAAAAARARGRHVGRPPALSTDQLRMARGMVAAGESVRDVARVLKVGRSTLYRSMAVAGVTEPC